jgi:hypothetical protein
VGAEILIETFIALIVGLVVGYCAKPKNLELQQQIDIYNRTYQKYEKEILYYKQLCHWHVEQQRKTNEQTKGS